MNSGFLCPLRCHRLSCRTCGPGVLWEISQAITEAVEIAGFDTMLSFTLPGRKTVEDRAGLVRKPYAGRGDPLRSRADLMKGLNGVFTALRQTESWAWKEGLPYPRYPFFQDYVSVIEYQKDGTAHAHVGVKGAVSWDLVNRLAWGAGLGFVWISGSKNHGRRGRLPRIRDAKDLSDYLSKYLTKSARALQRGEAKPEVLYYCLRDQRQRKAPQRTYTASREVGRTIAEARARFREWRGAGEAEVVLEDGEYVFQLREWEAVKVVLEDGEYVFYPLGHEKSPRIEECPGHPERIDPAPCARRRKRWGIPETAYSGCFKGLPFHGKTFDVQSTYAEDWVIPDFTPPEATASFLVPPRDLRPSGVGRLRPAVRREAEKGRGSAARRDLGVFLKVIWCRSRHFGCLGPDERGRSPG